MPLLDQSMALSDGEEDLAALQSKYPEFAPDFVALSSIRRLEPVREVIERWWYAFEPYSDANFAAEFKLRDSFFARCWELYLGATFISRGLKLAPNRASGPDFRIVCPNGSPVWIEAISVGKGTGKDRVPDPMPGIVYDDLSPQILLRLSNGIESKKDALHHYMESGVVGATDPFVIAINRSETEMFPVDLDCAQILKVLFGIGYPQLEIDLHDRTGSREITWSRRPTIAKQNNSQVSMQAFDDPSYSGVSGILYSERNCFYGPYLPSDLGEDLLFVHNPLARNPLETGFFPFGCEYIRDGDVLRVTRGYRTYKWMGTLNEEV